MKAMDATTQANINLDTLLDVVTLYPVCNKLDIFSIFIYIYEVVKLFLYSILSETIYSVVMSAAIDGFDIIIR